jgi:ParB family transcriptional regulator, chromosome partitioning protein
MTANKAVAEQQRAGVDKAVEKGSVKPAATPHEKRRALGRGLESLLPGVSRVFGRQESAAIIKPLTTEDTEGRGGNQAAGVESRESGGGLQASGVRLQQGEAGPGTAAASIENPVTTEDTEEHGGNQAAGVGNRESGGGLQASGVRLQQGETGLGTAAASIENPVTTEDTEGRGGRPETSAKSLDAEVESQSTNGESHTPLPGVIAELQAQAERRESLKQLPLDLIDDNPYQTRLFTKTTDQDEAGMKELVASIKTTGVITPILVRPAKDGRYTLIAGERRTKASRQAGRETIPAIVREVSNQQAAELTVIENLQRENLNCMDQARAFVMLSQTFQMTQDQIGVRVGMSRGTVSNYMRLVRLPEEVQRYLITNELTYSHARELLNLEDSQIIVKVARRAVKEMMSVEQLEKLIMDEEFGGRKQPAQLAHGGARWVDPNVRAAQRDLERVLGVKVRIRDRKGKGKITIEYATLEDYDRVIGMLRGKQ